MPEIIAFCGQKGAGKDTAAEVLVRAGFVRVAFADPIREVCRAVFGLTEAEMADRALKDTPLARWPHRSPRDLMREVGMMFRERIDPDTWIAAWRRRAQAHPRVVVPDLRFRNEAAAVRALGGTLVRVVRPATDDHGDPHPSEREMDAIREDVRLVNRAGLDEFRFRVDSRLLREARR